MEFWRLLCAANPSPSIRFANREVQLSTLLALKWRGEIEPLQPLPPNILEKLHNAIAKCKAIPPEDKRLVLGEEKTTD